MKGWLSSWGGSFINKRRKKVWKVAPLYFMWNIWRERNRRTFEIVKFRPSVEKLIFVSLLGLITITNWGLFVVVA